MMLIGAHHRPEVGEELPGRTVGDRVESFEVLLLRVHRDLEVEARDSRSIQRAHK